MPGQHRRGSQHRSESVRHFNRSFYCLRLLLMTETVALTGVLTSTGYRHNPVLVSFGYLTVLLALAVVLRTRDYDSKWPAPPGHLPRHRWGDNYLRWAHAEDL